MNKKVMVILSIVIVIVLIVLLLLFFNKGNDDNKSNKENEDALTLKNESIEVVDSEVFIEGTIVNLSKENISLKDIDIVVINSNNKEVLRVTSKIDKDLKPNESIIVSSQTKANLDSEQTYNLKIDY